MKQYYTLVHVFNDTNHRILSEYLDEQNIYYTVGADFSDELEEFGYVNPSVKWGTLLKTYIILVEDYELSAIMLSVGGIDIIKNRPAIRVRNIIRRYFSWVLN